jgi:hypothetical protein
MARLEARFHPPDQRNQNKYIVVGYVTWPDLSENARPVVEPSSSLALAPAPATILATLRHLVQTAARTRRHLESLRTQYWSFVHVQPFSLTTSRG